jgi:hypothetical protein
MAASGWSSCFGKVLKVSLRLSLVKLLYGKVVAQETKKQSEARKIYFNFSIFDSSLTKTK